MSPLRELHSEPVVAVFRPTLDQLRTALVDVAVSAVSTADMLERNGGYDLNLRGTLWLILRMADDGDERTSEVARLAGLIREAIRELESEVVS